MDAISFIKCLVEQIEMYKEASDLKKLGLTEREVAAQLARIKMYLPIMGEC